MQINWDNFKVNNMDSEGFHLKFENLCRQLFINENISGNKQFRYLHANPLNPGLETEPIYDEVNKRNIGFQAKFFELTVDYSQIEHSAEMTAKHYAGKVDHVFLFCNKPLTSSSLTKTVNILNAANIELELVTDKAILDLVELSYPYLAVTYFGNHTIDMDWIHAHSNRMFDELGERYNRVFNVETQFSIELSLFVHDQRAADYINAKKSTLLQEIERIYWNKDKSRPYLNTLRDVVITLPDVDIETLYEAVVWKEVLEKATATFLGEYSKELLALEDARKKQQDIAFGGSENREEHNKALRKYQDLGAQIRTLDELIGLPAIVEITEREQQLLHGNKLFVLGRVGIGKSQLLACETKDFLNSGRVALLLLSGIYFTSDPIQDQIMNNLVADFMS